MLLCFLYGLLIELYLHATHSLCVQVVNAAVIVDPSVKQVIATACDQTCSWYAPANKTTLETYCFKKPEASVSHSESDGVLSYETPHSNSLPNYSKQLYTGVCCLYPWRWAEQQSDTNSCSWHPLRHAAIVAIESSAAMDIHLFPSLGKIQDKYGEMDHTQSSSAGSPAKRRKTHSTNVSYFFVLQPSNWTFLGRLLYGAEGFGWCLFTSHHLLNIFSSFSFYCGDIFIFFPEDFLLPMSCLLHFVGDDLYFNQVFYSNLISYFPEKPPDVFYLRKPSTISIKWVFTVSFYVLFLT